MAKYRKKPVVIEAIKWKGHNWNEICDFLGVPENGHGHIESVENMQVIIQTLEGDMKADQGDFIIKGVNGEFYPCKPDIFHKTYEKVEEAN
jgi:hypothetical protein